MSKIINIGQTGSSQNTRVIDSEGISYAATNGEKDGVPKIVEPQFLEFSNFISLGAQNNSYNRVWKTEGYCGALNCTKQMEILEPQIAAMRGGNPDNPSERGRSNGRYRNERERNKQHIDGCPEG